MAFFFKCFPAIIEEGILYIAEPPLYKVDDKKNPFVINMLDYIKRYVEAVVKSYKIGWYDDRIKDPLEVQWMSQADIKEFLDSTARYVDTMHTIGDHYKTNERLIEMIYEEISYQNKIGSIYEMIHSLDIQQMMNRISAEFPEIYYDDKDNLIKGVIDGKYQLIEINESLIRRGLEIISLIQKWVGSPSVRLILKNKKTGTEESYNLLSILKILRKFQPNISHRFKGLGENEDEDIKTTIMDPNTRMLIRVQIGDIENDMKIMQMLRGGTPTDAQMRKLMMKEYKIPRELIDT